MAKSKLIVSDSFFKEIESRLKQAQKKIASDLMAEFFDVVMENVPLEDGHSHEAVLTAMSEMSGELHGKKFNEVARKHISKRSNDPEASSAVTTLIGDDRTEFVAAVDIRLPFMRALEYGLMIRVGDKSRNRGPKVFPVSRPKSKGPLYGARAAKGTFGGLRPGGRTPLSEADRAIIRKGIGILVWEENGVTHRALFRRPKAYRFWSKAISAVRSLAHKYRLKRT